MEVGQTMVVRIHIDGPVYPTVNDRHGFIPIRRRNLVTLLDQDSTNRDPFSSRRHRSVPDIAHLCRSKRSETLSSGKGSVLFIGETQTQQRHIWIHCKRVMQTFIYAEPRQHRLRLVAPARGEFAPWPVLQRLIVARRVPQQLARAEGLEADAAHLVRPSQRERLGDVALIHEGTDRET